MTQKCVIAFNDLTFQINRFIVMSITINREENYVV